MWKVKSHDSSKSAMSQDNTHSSLPHRTLTPSIVGGTVSPGRERSPRSSNFLRALAPRSRTASPSARLTLNGNGDALPSGSRSPISRTSTPLDQAFKHAAKTLKPYLKAMVAFASAREFEAKPSDWRLKQAEKKKAWVALTVCSLFLRFRHSK